MSDRNKNIHITITTDTIVRVVLVVAAFLILFRFITYVASSLQLIAISLFLAIALNPAVSWLTRRLKSKSRVRATAVAYLTVLALLVGFLALVVPPLVNQAVDVAGNIPTSIEDLNNQDTAFVRFIKERGLAEEYTQFVTNVRDNLQDLAKRAVGTLTTIGGALVAVITVLVMTFMMLIEGPSWLNRFWDIQPPAKLPQRKRMANKMYRMVTGYVNGQLLIATIAASFAFIALLISSTIFDVSVNAVALALIVGLMGLIPMIGNTLAAAVVVLVCLFVSLPLAITMAAFFLIYQQIENATLQPYIQSKSNELTPLTVFIAALLGIGVAGFLGALVAIPVVGCLRILLLELYGHKLKPQVS